MLVRKGHRSKVRALAFAPGGGALASIAGDSRFVWLWEAHTGKQLHKLKNPTNSSPVRAVGFSTDGGTVLTAAMDGTVRIWDVNTGAEVRAFEWGIGKVRAAVVSPDGALCAAGSDSGHLVV